MREHAKRALRRMAVVAIVQAAACVPPTYSPPIRTLPAIAPGGLRTDQVVEVAGGASFQDEVRAGDLHVAVRVHRFAVVEAGGTSAAHGPYFDLGWVGVRGIIADGRSPNGDGMVFEGELGGGIGCGGESKREPGPSLERLAGGAYFGFGAAGHVRRWYAAYLRARFQVTRAERTATTLWYFVVVGVELTPGPFFLGIAGGLAGYGNTQDERNSGLIEASVGFRL